MRNKYGILNFGKLIHDVGSGNAEWGDGNQASLDDVLTEEQKKIIDELHDNPHLSKLIYIDISITDGAGDTGSYIGICGHAGESHSGALIIPFLNENDGKVYHGFIYKSGNAYSIEI